MKHFLLQDIADDNIQQALATKTGTAPYLVAFKNSRDHALTGLFIVAEGVSIMAPVAGGIMGGILKLLIAYYVFDLEYPRQFAMVLGVLQTFLLGEVYKGRSSQKFKFFIERLRLAFNKVPDPAPVST